MPAANRKPLPLKTSSSLLVQGPFILGLCQLALRESHQSTLDHITLSSDQLLEHEGIPTHILIVGAGYIGVEFASIYRALGSKVTLIEEKERVLPAWDPLAGAKSRRTADK